MLQRVRGRFFERPDVHIPRRTGARIAPAGAVRILFATMWLVTAVLVVPQPSFAGLAETGAVIGHVVDPSGNGVAGASIRATAHGGNQTVRSDAAGRFIVHGTGRLVLVATAPGFSDASTTVVLKAGEEAAVTLVLGFMVVSERVTVTASGEDRATGGAGALTTVGAEALDRRGGQPLDDVLKRVPGFSLFRANSSRVANPTAQGLSLRGLGPSGASRALAFADDVVLNDPFGGWIYWNRVPAASIQRVEVARGGGSDRFGTDALGGVLQIVTQAPSAPRMRASLDLGTGDSVRGSVFISRPLDRWQPSLALDAGYLRGYPTVARNARGLVDMPAGGDWLSAVASMTRASESGGRTTLRATGFRESRQNGTRLQANATRLGDVALTSLGFVVGGVWRASVGLSRQRYSQSFSAVAADRASESLTRSQEVPGGSEWATASWGRPGRRLSWQASGEWRGTHGESREVPIVNGAEGRLTVVGGRQQVLGAAAQASFSAGRGLVFDAAARVDHWWLAGNDGGARRSGSQFSPRAGVSWQATKVLSARASVYRSFRAPTLNERYRGFRVGNVITRANDALKPEVLTGADLGVRLAWSRADLRVVGFVNRLAEPVANVTVQTGSVIVRERRNLGRIGARGAEVEGRLRVGRGSALRFSMLLIDSRIDASGQPGLDRHRTPLVPRFNASVGATAMLPASIQLGIDLRFLGHRFEDDRNELPVGRSLVADAWLARPISRRVTLTLSVENLANTEYEVGRTPLRLIGLPRVAHLGMRYGF